MCGGRSLIRLCLVSSLAFALVFTSCEKPPFQKSQVSGLSKPAPQSRQQPGSPPGREQTATPPPADEHPEPAPLHLQHATLALLGGSAARNHADALSAELSRRVDLQERIALDEILAEQGISLGNSPRLKGVAGAVAVERFELDGKGYISARLVAVQLGVVLGQWITPEEEDPNSWCSLVAEGVASLKIKLSIDPGQAIGLSLLNFTPKLVSSEIDAQRRALTLRKLLVSHLNQMPNVFVLERDRMGELQFEKSLAQFEPKPFKTGTWIVDGSWDVKDGKTTIELRLRPPDLDPEVLPVTASDSSFPSIASAVTAAIRQHLPAPDSPGAEHAPSWEPGREAVFYYQESDWLAKIGRLDDAVAASEASLALGANGMPEDLPKPLTFESLQLRRIYLEGCVYYQVARGVRSENPPYSEEQLAALLDWFHLWSSTVRPSSEEDRVLSIHAQEYLIGQFKRMEEAYRPLLDWYRNHKPEASARQHDLFRDLLAVYMGYFPAFLKLQGRDMSSFEAVERLGLAGDRSTLPAVLLEAFKTSSKKVRNAMAGDLSDEKLRRQAASSIYQYSKLLSKTQENLDHLLEKPTILSNPAGSEDEFALWQTLCDSLRATGELADQAAASFVVMELQKAKGGPEAIDAYEQTLRLVYQYRFELAAQGLLACFACRLIESWWTRDGTRYNRDYLECRYEESFWLPIHGVILRNQPIVDTSMAEFLKNNHSKAYGDPLTRDVALALMQPLKEVVQDPKRWWKDSSSKESYLRWFCESLGIPRELMLQTDDQPPLKLLPAPSWDPLLVKGWFRMSEMVDCRPIALAVKGAKVSFLVRDGRIAECDWKLRTIRVLPALPAPIRSAISDAFEEFDESGHWRVRADEPLRWVSTPYGGQHGVPSGFRLASHVCHLASLEYRGEDLVLLVPGAMVSLPQNGESWQIRDIPALRGKASMQFIDDQIVSYVGMLQKKDQGEGIFQVDPVTLEEKILASTLRREPRSDLERGNKTIYGVAPGFNRQLLVYCGGIQRWGADLGWLLELEPEMGKAQYLIDPKTQGEYFIPERVGWNENWSWAVMTAGGPSVAATAVNRKSGEARLLLVSQDEIGEKLAKLPARWQPGPNGPAFYSLPHVPDDRWNLGGRGTRGMDYDGDNLLLLGAEYIKKQGAVLWWWNRETGPEPIRIPLVVKILQQPGSELREDVAQFHDTKIALEFDRVQLRQDVLILESRQLSGFCYLPRAELDAYIREQRDKHQLPASPAPTQPAATP